MTFANKAKGAKEADAKNASFRKPKEPEGRDKSAKKIVEKLNASFASTRNKLLDSSIRSTRSKRKGVGKKEKAGKSNLPLKEAKKDKKSNSNLLEISPQLDLPNNISSSGSITIGTESDDIFSRISENKDDDEPLEPGARGRSTPVERGDKKKPKISIEKVKEHKKRERGGDDEKPDKKKQPTR